MSKHWLWLLGCLPAVTLIVVLGWESVAVRGTVGGIVGSVLAGYSWLRFQTARLDRMKGARF